MGMHHLSESWVGPKQGLQSQQHPHTCEPPDPCFIHLLLFTQPF